MRKLLLLLGIVPSDLNRLARKALVISTKALRIVRSSPVQALKVLIHGQTDDQLLAAIEKVLEYFIKEFEKAGADEDKQKSTAIHFAANLVTTMDRHALDEYHEYLSVTQKVFNANKADYKVSTNGGSTYAAKANA